MIANIIVDIAHSEVDRVFDYLPPDGAALWLGQRVQVPFGRTSVEGFVIGLADDTQVPREKLRRVTRTLEDTPAIPPELIRLAHWMREKYHCLLAEALRLMMPAEMRQDKVSAKEALVVRRLVPPEQLDAAIEALGERAIRQRAVLECLKAQPQWPLAQLGNIVPGGAEAAKSLVKKGLVEVEREQVLRTPYASMPITPDKPPQLLEAQRRAVAPILKALGDKGGSFLLHGVTGSGKTEVYFRIVEQALSREEGAIILVPEISLTPQMVERFRKRFGEQAAVLHSRLSAGERYDEWRRIRDGQARVAIGARSCVFAPVRQLSVIIVDEEHEQSYRADNHPRYDAIAVAGERIRMADGGVLVLGSATPSLERYAMARKGRIQLIPMPERIAGRPMPEVRIVDMREELAGGNRSIFSGLLASNMSRCIEAGEQVMLFVNRRGYATHVSCRNCGLVVQCEQCDVSMTYHTGGAPRLVCHYCGSEKPLPTVCPSCKSPSIRQFGLGTERVESEIKKLYPGVGVLRMDVDTTRTKDAHVNILNEFRDKRAQVLVGTQMIAKGLDFPDVTLVGMVAADVTLYLPDYRATEKTFQLITQMAGRAGRADKPGLVVVQTYSPQHYSIRSAAKHDYESFFYKEIARRRMDAYAPFARYVRFLFTGVNEQEVAQACAAFDKQLDGVFASPEIAAFLLSRKAAPAPVKRLRGDFRHHVLLKLREGEGLDGVMAILYEKAEGLKNRRVFASMEVNPSNML